MASMGYVVAVLLVFTYSGGYAHSAKFPFQNPNLPWNKRADDLVERLTVEEIANLSVGHWTNYNWGPGVATPGIPRLGVQPFKLIQGCSRGITMWPATGFPSTLALAATFSSDLLYNVSDAVSLEMRAFYNEDNKSTKVGRSGLFCLTARTNVMRHPLWGRSLESFGEDPYLIGEMAKAYIGGLQGNDKRYIRVAAGCNLYDAYAGPENYPASRFTFDAQISERDLRMTFLPAYKACVEGGARHIMCSYNSVNGAPSCANHRLLTDILRTEWGFPGHVISDAGAVFKIYDQHHFNTSALLGAVEAIKSGVNIELLGAGFNHVQFNQIPEMVKHGYLTIDDLHKMIRPVLLNRLLLGEFDPPEMVPFNKIDKSVVKNSAHQALALKSALQSFVLLKNQNNSLPVKIKLHKIAVVGPFANDVNLQYAEPYTSLSDPKLSLTPYQGLKPLAAEVTMAEGCSQRAHPPCQTYNKKEVSLAVNGAEYVFLCLGTGTPFESEGRDRRNLNLPPGQVALLKDVIAHASGKKIVLLLFNAGPLDVGFAQKSPEVSAILEVFYPGQGTGAALYQMISASGGSDSVPAGRLPNTWPASMAQVPSMLNYSMEGRTYRYFKGDPLYPYGYGLSYSRFNYSGMSVTPQTITAGDNVTVTVTVTNQGPYKADEVVQTYLSWTSPPVPAPHRQLVAFSRTTLSVNKPRSLQFTITAEQMSLWMDGDQSGFIVPPGKMTVFVGGQQPQQKMSAPSNVLSAHFNIVKKSTPTLYKLNGL